MPRGINEATSGMLSNMDRFQIIANNLANVGTTGYKQDRTFVRLLSEEDAAMNLTDVTGMLNRTLIQDQYIDFTQGEFNETGNPYDLAIGGEGFFVVETEKGEAYTRNGAFTLNENRLIVDYLGNTLKGSGGEIFINGTDFVITPAGEISVGGKTVDRIRIVVFEDDVSLKKVGGGLFELLPNAEEPRESEGFYKVIQGYLENSNVNVIDEMVKMIALGKEFEVNQKIIRASDELMGKVAREVGRIQ